MKDYIAAVDEQIAIEQAKSLARYQERAIENKPEVLKMYQKYFPKLWEVCEEKFQNAPSVFLNNGESNSFLSGLGAPGVLVDGLIFAVYRNSYCYSFYVGIYSGTEPVERGGVIISEGLNHDGKMAVLLKDLICE